MDQLREAQNQIQNLNHELQGLRQQLMEEQLKSKSYKESYEHAQQNYATGPTARDLNPIIQQIRNKNLTLREKQSIIYPNLKPSYPDNVNYQWVAPSKLSVRRDKNWYWTMGLIIMILITIAAIFRDNMWIAVILAFFFALMVNASIPAPDTVYKLTAQGIEIGEGDALEIYAWGQLLEYAYYYKNGTEVLYIETILPNPQRLQVLFNQEDRKNISLIMEANLPYKPPPKKQGWLLRLLDGIFIPLEEFKKLQLKIDEFYNRKYEDILQQLKNEGRIPTDVSMENIKFHEEIKTQKILDRLKNQQDDEVKRALGI